MKKLENLIKAFESLGIEVSCDTDFDSKEKLILIQLNEVYDIEGNEVSFVYSKTLDAIIKD